MVAIIDSFSSEVVNFESKAIPFFENLLTFFSANLKVDVIVVSTPNVWHFEHSKIITELGINVIIEKQITLESIHAKFWNI